MKRSLIFFTLFTFTGASAFFLSHKLNQKLKSETATPVREREEEEREEFEQAAAYLNMLRANQTSGKIEFTDFYEANEEAQYYANNPTSRAGLGLQWEEMGPDNIGGRTRAILFDKSNPSRVFAGAVSGGLWKSENGGASWKKVNGFDDFSSLIVSCITQGEDGTIYFGTGEAFGLQSDATPTAGATGFPGDGIWKSSDHGDTWTQIANVSASTLTISDAYAFINNMASGGTAYPSRVYAGIRSSTSIKGLQYYDGTKWTNVKGLPSGIVPCYDVEVGSNGVVHAIVGTKYYRSTDGDNFSSGGSGLPTLANRMDVAVSPTDANYVYIIASYFTTGSSYGELKGVYKSTDAGQSFTQIAPAGIAGSPNWEPVTQGSYALAIGVWPGNKDMVFIGGLDCYKGIPSTSAPYGYSWYKISNWFYAPFSSLYVHADVHRFTFHPTNPNIMFIGTDGGLSYTTNANVTYPTFTTRNLGYNVTQFYACAAKPGKGEVLAGAQDNGTVYIDFFGNTVQTGAVVKGGDGGDVAFSSRKPDAMFGEYVNGSIARSSNKGKTFNSFFDCHIDYNPTAAVVDPRGVSVNICGGDGYPDDGAAFITPFLLWENDLNDSSFFFVGTAKSVWMTQQGLNFGVTPTWFRLGNVNTGTIISLAASKDGKAVYAGTEGGGLYRVSGLNPDMRYKYSFIDTGTGSGTTATLPDQRKDVFKPDSLGIKMELIENLGRPITGIDVDDRDKNHVVVTLAKYGNTDYVYETTNADSSANPTFASIQGTGLPKIPVFCVIIDPYDSKKLILGTELGIYGSTNGGSTWQEENIGINRVPILKLKQIPVGTQSNVIYASAYGRGVFRTFTLANSVNEPLQDNLKEVNVFPNPATNEVNVSILLPFKGSTVEVNVFDLTGRLLKTITPGKLGPGYQLVKVATNDLSSGTYLLNIRTEDGQSNKKFVVVK